MKNITTRKQGLAGGKFFPLILLIALMAGTAGGQTVSDLFKQIEPSVVTIYTEEKVVSGYPGMDQVMMSSRGLGTGVLISAAGDILTAAHGVNTAESIVVGFFDGATASARIVGTVGSADAALLKLETVPPGRKPALIGNSDLMKTGDQVMVVGSPFGAQRNLSVGYISGRQVSENMASGLSQLEFLQTDAAINKGNTGGPMFNMRGEVVGIVSHVLSQNRGFEGIGFVLSSNVAKKLLMEQDPHWAGIEAFLLKDNMAKVLNLPQPGGILVQSVTPYSPAERMGLKGGIISAVIGEHELILGGDIILGIDGIPVMRDADIPMIQRHLSSLPAGQSIRLDILRDSRRITIESKAGGQ
ncbi:MAG: trypsin-like peptidase domain-containing protein [Bacteroidales bacterium]|nr:trypsin-like peptidase domain-containing protein [Bacteroidales bacterium]